jgi:hypothetical protein
VRFAEDCPSYGAWFASIGADYDSYLHILELNKAFRVEGDFGNDGKLLPPLPIEKLLLIWFQCRIRNSLVCSPNVPISKQSQSPSCP